MTVETQAPNPPGGTNPRVVDCAAEPKTPKGCKKFNEDSCEKEEICAKVKAQNAANGGNGPKRVDTSSDQYITDRTVTGPAAQAAFRNDNKALLDGGANPDIMQDKFVAPCRYNEWRGRKPSPDSSWQQPTPLEADHVQELQLGGAPGSENLKFLSARVNTYFGPKMQHFKPAHTGVKAVNCDCAE
jgi:hypothetical protein